jgi:hypothetical protein
MSCDFESEDIGWLEMIIRDPGLIPALIWQKMVFIWEAITGKSKPFTPGTPHIPPSPPAGSSPASLLGGGAD